MRGVGVAKRREGNEWKPKWLPEPERDRTAVDPSPPTKYYVFVPVVSTEGGARAAGATLIVAVYYLNIRV